MALFEFFVTRRGTRWYVDVGSENHGPYLSRRDALADAIDAADSVGRKRNRAVVFVKEPGKDAAPVWTYGKDAVPL